jgi:hypothetical protein
MVVMPPINGLYKEAPPTRHGDGTGGDGWKEGPSTRKRRWIKEFGG